MKITACSNLTSLNFSGSILDEYFCGALLSIVKHVPFVTSVNLQGCTIPEDCLKILQEVKLETNKTVEVTLPSGEKLSLVYADPSALLPSKAVKKLSAK